MIKNYLKITFRNLIKYKGYTMINILGLAVGIAFFILAVLYSNYHFGFDKFHTDIERIHWLTRLIPGENAKNLHSYFSSSQIKPVLKGKIPEIEDLVRFIQANDQVVRYKKKKFVEYRSYFVDENFLNIFSFKLLSGDPRYVLKEGNSIVITESIAKKYFNKENPIGKTLFFSGFKTDLKITGVLKDIPPNSSMNFNFLISSNSTKLRNHWDDSTTIIKIKKDTDIKKINLKLSKFVIDFLPEMNQKKEILYLKPFLDTHLKSEGIMGPFIWNSPVQFYLILIVSIALLIIVSVNFANLATAKYYNRAKEVGVRKSSGAHRGQLIFQFLSESVILAFLGLPIAMALYELIRPAFIAFIGVDIRLSLLESPGLILILFIMTLLLGLVSGIYPAFFLSSFQPAEVLKKNLKSGTQGASARKALVVFQFLISIVLIIFTFIVIKQFNFLHKVDLGLDRENVISIPISNEIENKIKILKEELIASPKLSMHHTHHGIHLTGMMNMK